MAAVLAQVLIRRDSTFFTPFNLFSLLSARSKEKVNSGVEMVPARRLKVPGQGVHICTMPPYTKKKLHSGNNIGIMLGAFSFKYR